MPNTARTCISGVKYTTPSPVTSYVGVLFSSATMHVQTSVRFASWCTSLDGGLMVVITAQTSQMGKGRSPGAPSGAVGWRWLLAPSIVLPGTLENEGFSRQVSSR